MLGAYLISPTPDGVTLSIRIAISVVVAFLLVAIVRRQEIPQQFPAVVASVVLGVCAALLTECAFWTFSLVFG